MAKKKKQGHPPSRSVYKLDQLMAIVDFHIRDITTKARKWDQAERAYEAYKRDGVDNDVREEDAVFANLAFEISDALASTLVPSDPELRVTPKREELGDAAAAQEGLASETFRQTDLEAVMRRNVTLAALHGYSFSKTVWKGVKNRPHILSRKAKQVFWDPSATEWDDISYIGEITTKTMSEIKRLGNKHKTPHYSAHAVEMARKNPSVPDWYDTNTVEGMSAEASTKMREMLGQRIVIEMVVMDPEGGPSWLFHLLPGVKEPLLSIELPYHYVRNPYTPMTLEVPIRGLMGVSPYELVRGLGKHRNGLMTTQAAVAVAAVPRVIINTAGLKDPDKFTTDLADHTNPHDAITVELKNNVPLGDVIMQTQTSSNTGDLQGVIDGLSTRIETTTGTPSYLRAGSSGADFSSEIQFQSHDLATRSGARRKKVHDHIRALGVAVLQLYAERLGVDDEVYVRAADGEVPQTVTRELADLAMFADRNGEAPLEMDYKVQVMDAAQSSPVIRLQAVQPFLEVLMAAGAQNQVDVAALISQILRWLDLEAAIPENPGEMTPEQQQQAAGAAQLAEAAPGAGASAPALAAAGSPGA